MDKIVVEEVSNYLDDKNGEDIDREALRQVVERAILKMIEEVREEE